MLCNKIQPWSFFGSGNEDFKCFSPYMGMAAILFNHAEWFEQIDDMPSTEGPVWYLVKIGLAVLKKTYKIYQILCMYIAQGQGQITLGDKILIVTERVSYFDHIL